MENKKHIQIPSAESVLLDLENTKIRMHDLFVKLISNSLKNSHFTQKYSFKYVDECLTKDVLLKNWTLPVKGHLEMNMKKHGFDDTKLYIRIEPLHQTFLQYGYDLYKITWDEQEDSFIIYLRPMKMKSLPPPYEEKKQKNISKIWKLFKKL